ncbi:MAG: NlpC/P60 family protein [Enhygromyxa sp.]
MSAVLLGAALLFGCTCSGDAGEVQAVTGIETPPEASECPSEPIPAERAPEVRPEHEDPEFWLAKLAPEAADTPLLGADERGFLRERVAALPGGWRDPLDEAVGDPELVARELRERIDWLRGRVSSGKYVELEPGTLEQAAARIEAAVPVEAPNLHFVARETQLWCVPASEGLFTEPVDRDFDRNYCASLHPGELVRALRRTPDDAWVYVDAGHSVGWIETQGGPLEPGITAETARARLAPPRLYLTADYQGLRHGSSFPLLGRDDQGFTIQVPGFEGPIERVLPTDAPVSEAPWELTRRKLFTQAFAQLEQPYGWGGRAGHRDCSSYLLDLFALFDLRLPRNSAVQAELGTRSVDLSPLDEQAKRAAIREAAQTGVVLLYMPGHILLYLGEDGGEDFGISALSEYLVPCPGGPDTIYKLDKVAVTTLELGRGTERRAFIERISKMAVFGPGVANPP